MAATDDQDQAGPDASFSVVRHGFDRAQVRRHVEMLAEAARQADTERGAAREEVAELRGELEIARREVTALSERLEKVVNLGDGPAEEHGRRVVEVAESQATEITDRAQAAADYTWSAAEQASTALRDRYQRMLADLDERHAEIHSAHESIMASARAQAEEMTTAAQRRRTEIDTAAERDRIRIDREFSESMSAKREELATELAAKRTECESEVERRLREADAEARRRVDTVTDKVHRLEAVRDQLTDRLRETRELLGRSASLLEPVDTEQDIEIDERLPMPDKPVPPQREATADEPAPH